MTEREPLYSSLRQAVGLRERARTPGIRDAFDRSVVAIPLEEGQALVRLVEAAQECADWHMAQGAKHVTDVKLWEAVTGLEHRADSGDCAESFDPPSPKVREWTW